VHACVTPVSRCVLIHPGAGDGRARARVCLGAMLGDAELVERASRLARAATGGAVVRMGNEARGAAIDKEVMPISLHAVQELSNSGTFKGAEGGYFVVMAVEEKEVLLRQTYAAVLGLIDPLGRICFRGVRGSLLDKAAKHSLCDKIVQGSTEAAARQARELLFDIDTQAAEPKVTAEAAKVRAWVAERVEMILPFLVKPEAEGGCGIDERTISRSWAFIAHPEVGSPGFPSARHYMQGERRPAADEAGLESEAAEAQEAQLPNLAEAASRATSVRGAEHAAGGLAASPGAGSPSEYGSAGGSSAISEATARQVEELMSPPYGLGKRVAKAVVSAGASAATLGRPGVTEAELLPLVEGYIEARHADSITAVERATLELAVVAAQGGLGAMVDSPSYRDWVPERTPRRWRGAARQPLRRRDPVRVRRRRRWRVSWRCRCRCCGRPSCGRVAGCPPEAVK
jgi:hypothetical protein